MTTPIYVSLTYDEYKQFEEQLLHYRQHETEHHTTDQRFYHKAFRLQIGGLMLEIQGPRVMAPQDTVMELEQRQTVPAIPPYKPGVER